MSTIRIQEFDTWRPGYGFASVRVLVAGVPTLAMIYADEELTQPLGNPQTLIEKSLAGVSYGKFAQSIYIGTPYQLAINSVDETGVIRPSLTTLDEQDASLALVTVDGGDQAVSLEDHLARLIDVRDYGEFLPVGNVAASSATNNNSLIAALGVGGARGGAIVSLPDGTYQIENVTIPEGVVIRGSGRVATTLQSTLAGQVAIIGGARAGFSRLTLDGISQVTNSIGVYAENKDQIVFDDVEIKRFDTGLYQKGGQFSSWRNLYISDCLSNYKAHGDDASGVGGPLQFNYWCGGKIELSAVVGVEYKYVDNVCQHNVIRGVIFDTNTGDAARITGARQTSFPECYWTGNTVDMVVADATPVTVDNTVIGVEVDGGSINGGSMSFAGTCEAVAFRRVDLEDVAITLTTPTHNILAQDCREISGVTFGGVTTAWLRKKLGDRGASSGVTTGNAATKAWATTLQPGQRVYLEGKVVGRGRNVVQDAFYHMAVSARRPGSTLNYDTQTANFTPGNVVTGATSGATARITADSDSGSAGALTVQDIVGVFVDNEIITDGATGSATVNGALVASNAALVGSVTDLRAAQETNANWAATFVANGPEIELRVTGDTAQTVEWVADVDLVSS